MHYFLAEVKQCLHAFMYFKLVMGYHIAWLDTSVHRNEL